MVDDEAAVRQLRRLRSTNGFNRRWVALFSAKRSQSVVRISATCRHVCGKKDVVFTIPIVRHVGGAGQTTLGGSAAGARAYAVATSDRQSADRTLTRWHANPLVRHAGAGDDHAGRAGDRDLGISDLSG